MKCRCWCLITPVDLATARTSNEKLAACFLGMNFGPITVVIFVWYFRREKALQDGLRSAVQVPLNVIKTATKVWNPMVELAKIGNINSKSDLQVGSKILV